MIRDALGQAGPAPSSASPDDTDLSIEELRKRFLSHGASECRVHLSQFGMGRSFVPIIDYAAIRGSLHRWIGTGATFGGPRRCSLRRNQSTVR